ncbi:MAG: hypothetical protein O6757_05840, partial [Alphaproteobacteria bacterium]|nr:hypothetical protein [Alphaproteobacteria bacterium]
QTTGAIKGMERRNAETVFIEALRTLTKRGQRVNTSTNTGNYAPKQMVKSRLPQARGYTIRELEAAMHRNFDAGLIEVREDGPATRRRSYIGIVGEPD